MRLSDEFKTNIHEIVERYGLSQFKWRVRLVNTETERSAEITDEPVAANETVEVIDDIHIGVVGNPIATVEYTDTKSRQGVSFT